MKPLGSHFSTQINLWLAGDDHYLPPVSDLRDGNLGDHELVGNALEQDLACPGSGREHKRAVQLTARDVFLAVEVLNPDTGD